MASSAWLGGGGDVTGPASATNGNLAVFSGTTGKVVADGGSPSGGGAPADATYLTQTPSSGLSAEQALSALSSGLMRVATTTGAVTSITDSAGLAANISDETGSGALVFASGPTFVTPILGVATATGLGIGASGTSDSLLLGNAVPVGWADVTLAREVVNSVPYLSMSPSGATLLAANSSAGLAWKNAAGAGTFGVLSASDDGMGAQTLSFCSNTLVINETTGVVESGFASDLGRAAAPWGVVYASGVSRSADDLTISTITSGDLILNPANDLLIGATPGDTDDIVVPTVGTLHFVKGIFTGLT